MVTTLIVCLVMIFCVWLGFYLNRHTGTKKDKEEAK